MRPRPSVVYLPLSSPGQAGAVERPDRWSLPYQDLRVTQLRLDAQLTLVLDETAEIVGGCGCSSTVGRSCTYRRTPGTRRGARPGRAACGRSACPAEGWRSGPDRL